MLNRHAVLAIVLSAAATVGTGAVLAGEERLPAKPLHGEYSRTVVVRRADRVVVDRYRAMERIERILSDVESIARLTPDREHGYLRSDDDREKLHDSRGRGRGRSGSGERFEAIDDLAVHMRGELTYLRRQLERARSTTQVRVRVPSALDHREFRRFAQSVRHASFADDKIAIVRDVARHAHFTADQVVAIVRIVPAWAEYDVAAAMHPRVIDPESFHVVYAAITFSSDRDRLHRRLARHR